MESRAAFGSSWLSVPDFWESLLMWTCERADSCFGVELLFIHKYMIIGGKAGIDCYK